MWKVGVIGIGSFGQKRVASLLALHQQVAAVVAFDPDLARGQQLAAQHGTSRLQLVTTLDQIWNDHEVRAVCIASPNATHVPYAIAALRHGKHVLSEKPLTNQLSAAQKVLAAARSEQLLVTVGTNHRHFPAVRHADALIDAGQLGHLLSLHGQIGHPGHRLVDTWFWQRDQALAGTLADNGQHLLDLALRWAAPFAGCYAFTSRRRWQTAEVEDYALVVLDRPTTGADLGCEAVLRSSWRQPHGYLNLEIWGTQGWLELEVGEQEQLSYQLNGQPRHLHHYDDQPPDALLRDSQAFLSTAAQPELYPAAYDHLQHLVSVNQACYLSAHEHCRIRLQL